MEFKPTERLLFSLQKEPYTALCFRNDAGEELVFPLTRELAQQLAIDLLGIPGVGGDFLPRVEAVLTARVLARQRTN